MGLFDAVFAKRERQRTQKSASAPLIRQHLRDSFRYYENGRWVTVPAEMLVGPVQRRLHRSARLRWNDSAPELSESERQRVFDSLTNYFQAHHITWSDAQV